MQQTLYSGMQCLVSVFLLKNKEVSIFLYFFLNYMPVTIFVHHVRETMVRHILIKIDLKSLTALYQEMEGYSWPASHMCQLALQLHVEQI